MRPVAKLSPSAWAGDFDRSSPNDFISVLRTSDWYSSESMREVAGEEADRVGVGGVAGAKDRLGDDLVRSAVGS